MIIGEALLARIRCVFAVLLLIAYSQTAFCCDSSMLELLTGASSQESVTAKLLVISSKMQVTAATAQAFNHAAAEKMHHEAMESWLYVASQITSNPPGQAATDPDFHSVIVQISRELGNIRQQIARRELDNVHDRLEMCVTRMSLLAAMINGHHRMIYFLRLELAVLNLRPVISLFEPVRESIIASDFLSMLAGAGLQKFQPAKERVNSLKKFFVVLRDSATSDQKRFSTASLTGYLSFYHEFMELKKLLLSEKYFNS